MKIRRSTSFTAFGKKLTLGNKKKKKLEIDFSCTPSYSFYENDSIHHSTPGPQGDHNAKPELSNSHLSGLSIPSNKSRIKKDIQYEEVKLSYEELFAENLKVNQKLRDQQNLVAQLKSQLKDERKQFEEEKVEIFAKHQAELKKKDDDLVEAALSGMQGLSLNTPKSKYKSSHINESGNKFSVSKAPVRFTDSRQQSTFTTSAPNDRFMSSQSLVATDRHKFTLSTAKLSSSKSIDGNVKVSATDLAPKLRDLTMSAINLHRSCDNASHFTNNWLKNARPQICTPQLRVTMSRVAEKLEEQEVNAVLDQATNLLRDCGDTMFGLKRDLVSLHAKEKRKVDAVKMEYGLLEN